MKKKFNVSGVCLPSIHYMVNLDSRLAKVRELVESGAYFTINRARQYGKTTLLHALADSLYPDCVVLSLDFQMLSHADFENESVFVTAFAREALAASFTESQMPAAIQSKLEAFASAIATSPVRLADLFFCLSGWCRESDRPIVLMIDEIDSASNNQVFLDFLAQLRGYYLQRDKRATFQSVILASVYDIQNLNLKIHPNTGHKRNSPWNIAAEFNIDMGFSAADIAGMLKEYDQDCCIGMDIGQMSSLIYDYTSGYPFLVSRLCKIIDEKLPSTAGYHEKAAAWSKAGFLAAVRILLSERNSLFESLAAKLADGPKLRDVICALLFYGREIPYHSLNQAISAAELLGFIKKEGNTAVIANRIFESVLYDLFLSEESVNNLMYGAALEDKNQFIQNGHLNMELVLERYAITL